MTRTIDDVEKRMSIDGRVLYDRFKNHIVQSINAFRKLNGNLKVIDAAKKLGFNKSTLNYWNTHNQVPAWPNYFRLMLALEKGDGKGLDLPVKNLENQFALYCAESINQYRELNNLYHVSDFSKSINEVSTPHKLSLLINKKVLMTPIVTIDVLTRITPKEKRRERVWYSITRLDELASGVYLRKIKHEYRKLTEPIVGSAEFEQCLESMKSFNPSTVEDRALYLRALVDELGAINDYFRDASLEDRDKLRLLVKDDVKYIRETEMEMRQMLRKEDDYQGWKEMNDEMMLNIKVKEEQK